MTVSNNDMDQFFSATGTSDASVAANYLEMAGFNVNQAVSLYFDLCTSPNWLSNAPECGSVSESSMSRSPKRAGGSSPPSPSKTVRVAPSKLPDLSPQRAPSRASCRASKRACCERVVNAGSKESPEKTNDGDCHVPAPLPVFTERLFRENWDVPRERTTKDVPAATNTMINYGNNESSGTQAFSSLFQPPDEIICSLELEEAMVLGRDTGKWVLVNIQKTDEFLSHALNRDVWNGRTVREVLNKNFIFWQRNADSGEGLMFTKLHKIDSLPFVGLVCHRTGRLLRSWNPQRLIQSVPDTIAQFIDFLETSRHGSAQVAQATKVSPTSDTIENAEHEDRQEPCVRTASVEASTGLFEGKGYSLVPKDPADAPPQLNAMNATLAEMHEERERRKLEENQRDT